jgi:nucleoside-diphosphate-sugar epimerase
LSVRWLHDLPVDFVQGDLSNSESLLDCVKDADYIIHLAGITKAKHKSEFFSENVTATKNLLQAASQLKCLKKFCFISSLTAVGSSKTGIPLDEQAPCSPMTTYGKSKLEAERLCKNYANTVPMVIIRPPAVFGPRDKDVLEIFKWVSYGLRPVLGSSAKTLSVVYAPDLAKGIVRATVDERTTGEIYNIADPTIYTFSSIMDQLATFIHKRSIQVHLPKEVVYSMAAITQVVSYMNKKPAILNIEKARDLLQKHWVCNPQKIQEHIGFHTTTCMDEGMKKTYTWYKEQGWL